MYVAMQHAFDILKVKSGFFRSHRMQELSSFARLAPYRAGALALPQASPVPQLYAIFPPQTRGANGMKASKAATSQTKRLIDICLSLVAIAFLLPLFAFVAFAIKLDSRGGIIFRQRRSGLYGEQFHILKFRTMTVCEDGAEIAHASKQDSRVTRVGAFLRATSIDELPQLFNVLMGDMSLIGPRPHALAHDRHYGGLIHHYRWRYRVKPGLTGLAQIRGLRGEIHNLGWMRQRLSADCEYVQNWSLMLDLAIIAKTVPLLFHDSAAY
jgi:putative colanic acid biosynthesis UDP-glucose lipid carrier transferase